MGLSFHLLWESSRGRSEQLSGPLLKAGVVVHPPCAPLILCSWGRGLDLVPSTFPPFLCGRASHRDLKMKQSPGLALEPPPVPALKLAERASPGVRPRAPFSPGPSYPVRMFSLVYYFLLEMSLLGMNTDWFVLKLINS